MANPTGKSGPRDKPYRDALRRAIARAMTDGDPHSLDKIAEKHLAMAAMGDMQAVKELADRIDGKVPQAVVGDDEFPAIQTSSETSDIELARRIAFILESGGRQQSDSLN